MKVLGKVALAAVALSLVGRAPASAQAWKWDWGINGGYSWLSDVLDQSQTGVADASGGSSIYLDNGLLGGTQLTYWVGKNFALRANMRYTSRDLKGSDMGDAADFDFVENIHLWGGTIDGMLRFKGPADEYSGTEFLPYLAFGAGLKWHNPAGDRFTCNDATEGKSWSCAPFTTGIPATPKTWAFGEQKVFTGLVGLGADWRLSRNFAIRTEVNDQIFKPQIYVATASGTTDTYTLPDGDETEAKVVHEIAAQVGLHFLFGVPRPVVAVVPPPAPAPTPIVETPRPVETPKPRIDDISVCVVDPTVAGGLRMQNALYRYEQRDTMVMVNGSNVPLRNAIGSVTVANNADWYVRGTPLMMTVGTEQVQFLTTGSPTMVTSSDLAYLGTINGLPIYADRDDVADVRDELEELNRAQRGTDLGKILSEHKDLREEMSDVKLFYVPFQPTGCVFQGVQMQQPVRKGKQ